MNRYKIEYRLYKDMGAVTPAVYTLFDGNGQQISDAVVRPEINRVSTFDFAIYPAHEHYARMMPRLGFCTVWDMAYSPAKLVFNGQIRSTQTDLYGERTVHCESDLGLLNDWRVKHAALNQDASYPGLSGSVALALIFGSTESIPSLVAPATLKLVEDGSVIVPTVGTATFPSAVTIEYNDMSVKTPGVSPGIEPIEFQAGTAMDALNTFLRAWPGRIDITYPVDLWHPVVNYTHENCITKHVCSQSITVGVNVLSLDRNLEPEEPIVTSIVPSYTAVYKTDSLARKAGEANWHTTGAPYAVTELESLFGTRTGSPKVVDIKIEYDSFRAYVEDLGAYFVADRNPTVDSSWYAVSDTGLTNPIPFATIAQLYSDAILEDWIDGAVDEGGYSSRAAYFADMFDIENDGLAYDIQVVDLSLTDPAIESFEIGDYAFYAGDQLLITGKAINLFSPAENSVDLNNKPESLTEYLSKAR